MKVMVTNYRISNVAPIAERTVIYQTVYEVFVILKRVIHIIPLLSLLANV